MNAYGMPKYFSPLLNLIFALVKIIQQLFQLRVNKLNVIYDTISFEIIVGI